MKRLLTMTEHWMGKRTAHPQRHKRIFGFAACLRYIDGRRHRGLTQSVMIPLLGCAIALGLMTPALAMHITIPDLPTLRTPLPEEGYLAYLFNPVRSRFGDEYTGWIDARHPALDGMPPTDAERQFGFDRSDHFVTVRTVTATDNMGTPAMPQVRRDFDFSNKIYAQAGMSVVRSENATLTLNGMNGTPNVTWPIDQAGEDDTLKSLARSNDPKTMNAYYVKEYTPAVNGLTSPPSGFGGNVPRNDGSGIADSAQTSTFAHELGHMLLNGNALHMECAAKPADAGPSESCDAANLMFKTGSNFTFADIGRTKGKIESNQIDRIFENGGANNPGFVTKQDFDASGDRVDFDFVADQVNLEDRANGADNHRGIDSLFWGIGTTVERTHLTSDGTGFSDSHVHVVSDMFPDPTPKDFAGPFFRTVDVFSLITRYADSDVSGEVGVAPRDKALDYDLFFRDLNNQLIPGIPLFDFMPGWTNATHADDYIARWLSPVPANGVFILADTSDGHDGNVQIDAIIASAAAVPEPSTVLLLGAGLLGLFSYRWRRGKEISGSNTDCTRGDENATEK